MTTKETKVIVSAETSKYERGMRNMKRANAKTTRAMEKAWGGVQKAMVGVTAGAVALAYGMKHVIDVASDLQEVVGKFSVVFKDQMDSAEESSRVLVDAYAMSTRESKQYLSSIQDLLVPMGMASKQAGALSFEVVKLAADLGSFNNLSTAQVMVDIESALVGNFETMKKYGVVLNEHVLKQKALEMGMYSGKGMVDANTKAFVAYTLMMEGSKAAIGDMARTSDSYANQVKKLKANIEDMSAAIGTKLIPIVSEWLVEANEWFENNEKITDQIGVFAKHILELTTTLGKATIGVVEYFNVWVETWKALGLASSGQITLNEAITNGAEAIERFNMGLGETAKIYSIGPNTEGYEIYNPPIPEKDNAMAVMGGDITNDDENRQKELEKLVEQEEAKYQIAVDGWSMLDEALIERHGMIEAMESGHAQTLADIEQNKQNKILALEKKVSSSRLKTAISLGTALLNFAGVNAKAIFLVVKSVEIGKAIAGTHAAAAMALATPPAPNLVLEAVALKAGYWNVAAIAATSLGQLASSGNSGATGGGSYTSPTVTTDASMYQPAESQEEKKGTLTINIQGDYIGDEGYVEMLAEKISEAVEDRDVTLISSNSKYADMLV